ncbi:MAG: GNAT family N-acetyltransferase [Acidobacteriota bacterium]
MDNCEMGFPRIRQIESTHIADLIRIAEDTNLNRWTAQHYLDELKNPVSIMLRLELDDNLTLGFIVGRIVAAASHDLAVDAEIYNIGVDPSVQRNGYGQMLLDAFLSASRKSEVGRIWLEVRETNDPAVNLYVKNGFVPVTVRKDFYSDPRENGILMRCDIQ